MLFGRVKWDKGMKHGFEEFGDWAQLSSLKECMNVRRTQSVGGRRVLGSEE